MPRSPAAFAATLRAALPKDIALGEADPRRLYPLQPGEGLDGAVPARQLEFAAGRAAARIALGMPDQPIPAGPQRAPIWPPGRVGSITHCAGLCLAIAAEAGSYEGLGLDVEPEAEFAPDHWAQVLRPDETATDGIAVLAHFVAKEAAYKAQFEITKQLFGFQTLRLEMHECLFQAEFMETVAPFRKGHRLSGKLLKSGGYLGAVVALRRPGSGV